MTWNLETSLAEAVAAAESHFDGQEYRAALAIYREILQWRLSGSEGRGTAFDAVLIERVADLATLFGQYRAADDLLSALADWLNASGNSAAADYTFTKLAGLHFAQDRLTGVRAALARVSFLSAPLEDIDTTLAGLEQWEGRLPVLSAGREERRLVLSRFYLEYAKLLSALGLFVPAGHVAQRGLTLASESSASEMREAIPALTLALATATVERGDAHGALTQLQVSAEGREERHVVQTQGTASIDALWRHPAWRVRRLELRAKAFLLQGQLGAAKAALDEVVSLCIDGGFEAAAGRAAMNLAQVLILLNQTNAASDLLTASEQRASAIGDAAAARRASTLQTLARLRAQSLADAVAITSSVFELWSDEPPRAPGAAPPDTLPDPESCASFLATFEDRALMFQWHLGRRDWGAATQCLEALASRAAATDSMLIVGRMLMMESMLHYYRGELEEARQGFATAASAFGELELAPDQWQSLRFLGWTLKQLGRNSEAQRYVTHADTLLDTLTRSLADEDKAAFWLNKWTADEEFLAGELEGLVALGRAARTSRWLRRMWLSWSLRRRLAAFVGHVDRHVDLTLGRALNGGSPSPVTAPGGPTLRAPGDTAVIGFFVLPDRLFVARLCGWSVDVAIRPVTRAMLRELVADCHREMMWLTPGQPNAAMSRLVSAVGLQPVLAALPAGVRHLTIVADDSLRGLPFAALEQDGTPLVERFTVTTAFAWSDVRRRPARASSALVAGAGAVARGWPELPHVGLEVSAVSDLLQARGFEVTRLEELAATPAAVAARLPLSSCLHVACHGVFRPDRPDQSGLVLAGGDDAALTLRDLAVMDLGGMNLAVLSACWAADSFVLPGRVVLSLPYTLWRAGARCIVAPLWEVDDTVALSFMHRFYELLIARPAREALRQVQRECRAGMLPDCDAPLASSPLSWAAFQLYGRGTISLAS